MFLVEAVLQTFFSAEIEDQYQRSYTKIRFDPDVLGSVVCDPGGREENQDAWGFAEASDGTKVLAVADGLGGHKGGRIASALAVRSALKVCENPTFNGQSSAILEEMFREADQAIRNLAAHEHDLETMASTLLIVLMKGYKLLWGHVGDVRLYLVRKGKIYFQTKDQSITQRMVDAKLLTPNQVRWHPSRSQILQAVGFGEDAIKPDISEKGQLLPGDLLVAVSDGFWEWINEETLVKFQDLDDSRKALAEAERLLRREAAKEGGRNDNYTAIFLNRRKKKLNLFPLNIFSKIKTLFRADSSKTEPVKFPLE